MDPDCAICGGAANLRCDCEAKALETAISHAERRMMDAMYASIRDWARLHAQDYILAYFGVLSERRKAAHSEHLDSLQQAAYYNYRPAPHQSEIAHAQQVLKRGIDEDWQTSVQRYPEVLQYFFSLVELTVPPEDDPAVKDPPLSALSGSRKVTRRPATIANGPFHPPPETMRDRRTPPPPPPMPMQGMGRRTPRPPSRGERRNSRLPPPPPTTYYAGPQW
ncbi:uncharacterized protein DNG_08653 [Cephalotrichum gorgonifer]|uniref:Uncharacterized protein n=1 Tax=Cephalotrichum gorgonifer TaxID=2041049 RepID=A0AAE8N5G6_9PEZI|nr:uncharacterized protein DNG_08653 [Cephalotrichum gorgonifer]